MTHPNQIDFIKTTLNNLSEKDGENEKNIAIILAGGEGKRMRSKTPKVMFPLWGKASILRICEEVEKGLKKNHQVVVLGKQALRVAALFQKQSNRSFVYQSQQLGTGHAVQIALKLIGEKKDVNVFIFPGDIGLIDAKTLKAFQNAFINSNADMMMLTGKYQGEKKLNYYGRILRANKKSHKSVSDKKSDQNQPTIVGIVQHKEILAMKGDRDLVKNYQGKIFSYSKEELLNIDEYDAMVFAFKFKPLWKYLFSLKSDNQQQEFYLTDLVEIFNQNNLKVSSWQMDKNDSLLGFNDRYTLKKMENLARKRCYELLKNLIHIEDEDRFFIEDSVVASILKLAGEQLNLDIHIGRDVYVGKGVQVNEGTFLGNRAYLCGSIKLGKNTHIGEEVSIKASEDEEIKIGDLVTIEKRCTVEGPLSVGQAVCIKRNTTILGTKKLPTQIGSYSMIGESSFIRSSILDSKSFVEHSILEEKRTKCFFSKDGTVIKIKYFRPSTLGKESVINL